jgi:hypothetical protein
MPGMDAEEHPYRASPFYGRFAWIAFLPHHKDFPVAASC